MLLPFWQTNVKVGLMDNIEPCILLWTVFISFFAKVNTLFWGLQAISKIFIFSRRKWLSLEYVFSFLVWDFTYCKLIFGFSVAIVKKYLKTI